MDIIHHATCPRGTFNEEIDRDFQSIDAANQPSVHRSEADPLKRPGNSVICSRAGSQGNPKIHVQGHA